jgi:NAD(P)-dependent dehydrogenase (short-subunit alcohol dehydrogenase family)
MFEGKVALVTGSADGLGKVTAIMLAQRGADLVLCDVLEEKLEQTCKEIEVLGRKCLACRADVTLRSEVEHMVGSAVNRFAKIDLLVNNAGGPMFGPREIEESTDEEWDRVLDVNLKGAFICCRAVVPVMKREKSGAIVSLSSAGARDGGGGGGPAYVAAKAGIIGLTHNLARHLAPFNIRVNAVAPGLTLTSDTQRTRVFSDAYHERLQRTLDSVAMKRCAEPQEIASVICFLLSNDASFITGVTLDVSGGRCFT